MRPIQPTPIQPTPMKDYSGAFLALTLVGITVMVVGLALATS